MRFLADDYILKKEIRRIKLVATRRMESITKQNVNEIRIFLAKNPLYMIPWATENNLILKYVKRIENEKR